ncbi:MAG: hypothetical protein WAO33_07805 [Candidatus Nanopelagicales bacterium]|nr:hypothetical protein [Actinomycetes bacterium]MCH9840725.1 hypothetical protein [Actinomycetes bacterium]
MSQAVAAVVVTASAPRAKSAGLTSAVTSSQIRNISSLVYRTLDMSAISSLELHWLHKQEFCLVETFLPKAHFSGK